MQKNRSPLRDEDAEKESPARAFAALTITCLLVVMVPAMVAFIGYRAIMLHGPSTAVVIAGDNSLDGAKIKVTELFDSHRSWLTTLDSENNWVSPILLDPGSYHVTVNHRGREILDANFSPDQTNGVRFDLPSLVWIIANPSLAKGKIEIVHVGNNPRIPRSIPVRLNLENHYRDPAYLEMGEYRVIVHDPKDPSRTLVQAEFIVDRVTIVRIDLAKIAAEQAE